jgi:hypothetical protein
MALCDRMMCNYLIRKKIAEKKCFLEIFCSPFTNLSIIIPQKKIRTQRFFLFFFNVHGF